MKIRFNKNDIVSEKHHDRFDRFEKIKSREKIKDKDKSKNKNKDKNKSSNNDNSNNNESSSILDRQNFVVESSSIDLTDPSLIYAKVVEVHKKYCFVSSQKDNEINTHDIYLATIPKKHLQSSRMDRNFVCVGDNVVCKLDQTSINISKEFLPQVSIVARVKRVNEIYRIDPFLKDRIHTIASNIDYLLIVSSFLSPKINWKFIDRYLVLAKYSDIIPIIILNKKDLLMKSKKEDPNFYKDSLEKIEYYKNMGYNILLMEASSSIKKQKQNPDFLKLKELLHGKISLLSGQSGVGKSSILNLFNPEIIQAVEPNSDISYKGRHTTSFTSFIKIDNGYLIDTPGIRSFVIPEINSFYLANCFLDFIPYLDGCMYKSECSHNSEPECMIKTKVNEGVIPEWRYQSYLNILLKITGREGRFSLHSKDKGSYIDMDIDGD